MCKQFPIGKRWEGIEGRGKGREGRGGREERLGRRVTEKN